jgi:pimeloyl-ACP methyl ester carboxylesterase
VLIMAGPENTSTDITSPHITSASGVRLHVEIDGPADGPPVLVLHGITGCTATWDWLVPIVAATHRMVRLDFRGHGDSDRAPDAYSSEGYVADATAVCEALFDGPCTVVGHSLGGVTALGLAQTRPDLVEALVLEDPPMGRSEGEQTLEGNSLLDAFRMMRQSVPALQASGVDLASLTTMLGQMPSPAGPAFGEVLYDDAVAAMASALLRLDASVLDPVLAGVAMTWVYDVDRPLAQRGVLVAADPAAPDCVCRPEFIERAVAAGTSLEVRTPVGAGHLIHDSRATRDHVGQAVRDVLGL